MRVLEKRNDGPKGRGGKAPCNLCLTDAEIVIHPEPNQVRVSSPARDGFHLVEVQLSRAEVCQIGYRMGLFDLTVAEQLKRG